MPTDLEVRPFTDSVDICSETAVRLTAPFGDGSEALMRLTLFHGFEESVVLLTAHHSAADGKTNVLVLQDLLASVAGDPPVGDSPWLSPSALLHRPEPAPYVKSSEPDEQQATGRQTRDWPNVQVEWAQLTPEQTQALLEKARANETTIQGTLVAAFVTVMDRKRRGLSTASVMRCATPIDLRSVAGVPDASGLLITNYVGSVPCRPELPFWDLARWVRDDLREPRTLDGSERILAKLDKLVAQEQSPAQFLERAASAGSWDLMVTNGGSYRFPTQYGELRVTALISGVASGSPPVQTISVNTLDGALGMAHISRQPIAGLLEQANNLLAVA